MLVSFSVSNFRSIGEEITLTMVASNHYSDHPTHVLRLPEGDRGVLRTAVIYGANAAGKSNLVKAIARAQDMILGRGSWGIADDAYAFVPDPGSDPSSFEFRFVAAERIFAYGFDVSGNAIRGEWLAIVSHKGDDTALFERNGEGRTSIHAAQIRRHFANDTKFLALLESLADTDLNDNQLFLNHAGKVRGSTLGPTMKAVIDWFTTSLVVVPIDSPPEHTFRRLARDPQLMTFAKGLLGGVGTGISELDVVERGSSMPSRFFEAIEDIERWSADQLDKFSLIARDPRSPDRVVSRTLMAGHDRNGVEYRLPMDRESDGTRRLLGLASLLTSGVESPRVFVIDELDRSLHPALCWKFLELFANSMPGAKRQLVVTTHEAHLLNQDLLRRDEYWFMEKDESQQSRLGPLSAYRDVRKDLQLEKGYLNGRFGAVPVIGSTEQLERLLAPFTKEAVDHAAQESPT
jgi:hypothetical protein